MSMIEEMTRMARAESKAAMAIWRVGDAVGSRPRPRMAAIRANARVMARIVADVSGETGVPEADIMSGRSRRHSDPRAVAIGRARKAGVHIPEIAVHFKRDYTTIKAALVRADLIANNA